MDLVQIIQHQKKILRPTGVLLSFALSLLSNGCATSAQTRTGFISNYGNLKPVKDSPGLYADKEAAHDSNRFIRVAPVDWQAKNKDPGVFDEHERNGLCVFAQSEFERALTSVQPTPQAQAADRHPLELRSAITRVETSNPALNVITTLALFMPLNNGGICLEWKLVDPSSDETVAQGVVVQTGKPWQVKASFQTLGHAKAGLTKISTELASYLSGRSNDSGRVN